MKENEAAVPEHDILGSEFREKLEATTVDFDIYDKLRSQATNSEKLGFKINQFSFLIRDNPTTINPLPWTHVYVSGGKITCSLSDRCGRSIIKTGKKDSIKFRCLHEEIVRIYSGIKDCSPTGTATCANCNITFDNRLGGQCKYCKGNVRYCTQVCQVSKLFCANFYSSLILRSSCDIILVKLQESHWPKHLEQCSKTMSYLETSAKYMLETAVLPVKEEILKDIKHRNALETLGKSGWPRNYYNNREKCPICESELSSGYKRKQQSAENQAVLLSKDHCIPVIVLSKKCKSCLLLVQATTLELGLLNVGDTLLLSLELMYEMQHFIRYFFFI